MRTCHREIPKAGGFPEGTTRKMPVLLQHLSRETGQSAPGIEVDDPVYIHPPAVSVTVMSDAKVAVHPSMAFSSC